MSMITVQIGEVASYTAAGVGIHEGDVISNLWFEAGKATHQNRQGLLGQLAMDVSTFSSVRGFDLDVIQGKRGLILAGGVDGAGTKPELAERLDEARPYTYKTTVEDADRDHAGIPHDVFAMCVDDLARDGVEPFGMFLLYDTSNLKKELAIDITKQLKAGAISASALANVVLLNGESAELGDRVGGHGDVNYNLGGMALGAAHKSRIMTGEKVKEKDVIYALRDKDPTKRGPRSNGFSLIRKVLTARYGEDWMKLLEDEKGQAFVQQLLVPSTIFAPTIVDMHGGYDLDRAPRVEDAHAFVHVTGGGIPGKLQRVLAVNGLGAVISEPFEPPQPMQEIQEMSLKVGGDLATNDPDAYQTLHEGNEYLVIAPESEEGNVVATADDHGKEAKPIGEIVAMPGIELKSQGVTNPGEWIRFEPKAA